MSELPQLADRRAELGDRRVQYAGELDAARESPLGQPQRHPQSYQPLLGTIVEVAFALDALFVADPEQPGAALVGSG